MEKLILFNKLYINNLRKVSGTLQSTNTKERHIPIFYNVLFVIYSFKNHPFTLQIANYLFQGVFLEALYKFNSGQAIFLQL